MTNAARLAWLWTGVVVLCSVVLVPVQGQDSADYVFATMWLLLAILFTGLGAFIISRQPGNRIARLLLLIGAALVVDSAAQSALTTRRSR